MKTSFLTTTLAVVIFFVLATTAMAGTYTANTTVLLDSFTPWDLPVGNNVDFHGYISQYNTSTASTSTNSWLDWLPWATQPWYSSSSYNSLDETTTAQSGVRLNGDSGGSFGTDTSSTFSETVSTIWALNSTFYPLKDRLSISAQSYRLLNTTSSSSFYNWDCRDLINAGLGGLCSGSNQWSRTSSNQMIGGTWTAFDIIGGGLFMNMQSGNFDPWSYSYSDSGFDSWPSQQFTSDGVPTTTLSGNADSAAPEPGTLPLIIGGGLVAVGFRSRRRKSAQ